MKMITTLRNTYIYYLYSNISQNLFDTKKEDLIQTRLVQVHVQQDKLCPHRELLWWFSCLPPSSYVWLSVYNQIKYCVERTCTESKWLPNLSLWVEMKIHLCHTPTAPQLLHLLNPMKVAPNKSWDPWAPFLMWPLLLFTHIPVCSVLSLCFETSVKASSYSVWAFTQVFE